MGTNISAFSALFFSVPEFLLPGAEIYEMTSDYGWQDVWEKTVQLSGVEVELNTCVNTVEYISDDVGVNLTCTHLPTGARNTYRFDFCIFSMPEPLKVIANPTCRQKSILNKFSNFRPAVTTVLEMNSDVMATRLISDSESNFIESDLHGFSLYKKNVSLFIFA